jgi:hypothetical protein
VKFLFHTHLALDFPERISEIAEAYQKHEFVTVSGKAELYREITDSDVMVDHRIDEELLNAAMKLK